MPFYFILILAIIVYNQAKRIVRLLCSLKSQKSNFWMDEQWMNSFQSTCWTCKISCKTHLFLTYLPALTASLFNTALFINSLTELCLHLNWTDVLLLVLCSLMACFITMLVLTVYI